jgi:hypothetical protein
MNAGLRRSHRWNIRRIDSFNQRSGTGGHC